MSQISAEYIWGSHTEQEGVDRKLTRHQILMLRKLLDIG